STRSKSPPSISAPWPDPWPPPPPKPSPPASSAPSTAISSPPPTKPHPPTRPPLHLHPRKPHSSQLIAHKLTARDPKPTSLPQPQFQDPPATHSPAPSLTHIQSG